MTSGIKKAYISVDIEGVAGVTSWDETQRDGHFYPYFRKQMAYETNAAIEALLEAGVEEIYVKDAHGDGRNIIPNDLNENALLIRGLTPCPELMMAKISEEFDAVLFIGYHAKPGTADATLKHFYSTEVIDCRINDISLSEGAYNSLIAGYYNVPVIFLAGDKAACEDIRTHIPNIETVSVKEGYEQGCVSLHPKKAQEKIKEGVRKALTIKETTTPLKLDSPFKVEIMLRREELVVNHQLYPGAKLKDSRTVMFETDDFYKAIIFVRTFGARSL